MSHTRRELDCTIVFEGEAVPAVAGEPVAVALFAAGTRVLSRSVKYHRPRSFFCLAGHCGACLMRIDGVPNVKSCRAAAREGMRIERQNAFPSGSFDVLGAADWFFPKGMDHHTLLTSSRSLNAVMRKVVREVGGLGQLPEEQSVPSGGTTSERRHVDVVVVGAGPAGLQASIAVARRTPGRKVLLLDERDVPGGSLCAHPAWGMESARALAAEAERAGVEILCDAPVFGYYPEDEGGVLAVELAASAGVGSLLLISADRYVYATGGYDVNALFCDNDRPGIFAARAVGLLLIRQRVVPAKRPLVLGRGEYAQALAEALSRAGCSVERVDGVRETPVHASGHTWVSDLEVERVGDRKRRRVRCDLVAVAATPSPATELLRLYGVEVAWRPEAGGFAAVTDEDGRTCVPGVYACGDVCGYEGVAAARLAGERAGVAVGRSLGAP